MSGDPDQLGALLTEDVLHISDGGAARHAARRPITGRDKVARFFCNIASRLPSTGEVQTCVVNGRPGMVVVVDGAPFMVMALEFRDGLVSATLAVLNPDKLTGVLGRA